MEAARSAPAIPEALAEATRHQPRARATLVAALASPGHAYIFRGPRGAGKAAAARAFAAELLTDGASDPDDARRRALLDPSPHPDLAWLRPPGAQHLVEDVRESVIRASSSSAAEGGRRVFVIEEAEDLRDEIAAERVAEDARGARALRPPDPDLLGAGAARRDDSLPLHPGRVRAWGARRGARGARCRRRGSRRGSPERGRRRAREAPARREWNSAGRRPRRPLRARRARRRLLQSPGADCSTQPEKPARRSAVRRRSAWWRRPRRWRNMAARGG